MKFFLDTASIEQIKKWKKINVVDVSDAFWCNSKKS